MRRASALLITAGLVVASLSACSSDPLASCDAPVSSGRASDLITVTGKTNSKPDVTFPVPLHTSTTERTVVDAGDGAVVHQYQKVVIDASIYNATTGTVLQQTTYDPSTPTPVVLNDKLIAGLTKGLQCVRVGSRVAIAIAPKDAFGDAGNPQAGIGKSDALIAVVDVHRAYPTHATGTPQPHTPGFPSVVLAPNGRPGISITQKEPPKTEKVAVLKQGHGKKVTEGDSVTVHYTAVSWSSKLVTASTWATHSPASIATAADKQDQNGVPAGFVRAIVGKPVGSQVIAIVPPEGKNKDVTDTVVYVIDILGID